MMATRRGLREVVDVLYALWKLSADREVAPVCGVIDRRGLGGMRCVVAKPRIEGFDRHRPFRAVNRRWTQLTQTCGVLESC
jgi:hypothetical protein